MTLAYPKLTADAREEIAFDHFTNALSDAEFALKVKEKAPMSLDEALRIALRLEACQKSTYMPKNDEDRIERPRQSIRTTGKQPEPKAPNQTVEDRHVENVCGCHSSVRGIEKVDSWQHTAASGDGKSSSVVYCFSWSVGCFAAVSKFRQSEIRFCQGKCDDVRQATADESVSWIPCVLGLRNPRTCET